MMLDVGILFRMVDKTPAKVKPKSSFPEPVRILQTGIPL